MIHENTRIYPCSVMGYRRYLVLSEAEINIVVQIAEDTINFSWSLATHGTETSWSPLARTSSNTSKRQNLNI